MRRSLPALVAGAIVVLLAVALLWPTGQTATGEPSSRSTRQATFGDRDADGVLERGHGEPLADRTELAPRSRVARPLATLAQISDAHVRDEESPARAFFLDRLGEPFTSTFRPQEALSPQTLTAAVRSINRLRPDAVLETGDLADNAQANEMDQALAVLRGGRVVPGSGARGYDGPQSASRADPFLYRPGLDAPRHPDLLASAQRPFRSPGLRAPWYPVAGNHDLLVQGEATAVPAPAGPGHRLADPGGARRGAPDPARRPGVRPRRDRRRAGSRAPGAHHLDGRRSRAEAVERGRGGRAPAPGQRTGGAGARLDYSFSVGRHLRVITLDVVNRAGGSQAVVGAAQLAWLRDQLARAGDRWVMVLSHQPLAGARGGAAVLSELDRNPRVVAAVSGHTHTNSIRPRRSPAGGYWLIATASLTDYPQQARALKLVRTVGGGVAVETWMVDTAPSRLGDTARDLSYLDAQGGRPQGNAGARRDRNVRLFKARRSASARGPRATRSSRSVRWLARKSPAKRAPAHEPGDDAARRAHGRRWAVKDLNLQP
ncbi:MAG: metallophosphoesterase [Thermoleophilaceae bacterium]